jgi:hypothetical protein
MANLLQREQTPSAGHAAINKRHDKSCQSNLSEVVSIRSSLWFESTQRLHGRLGGDKVGNTGGTLSKGTFKSTIGAVIQYDGDLTSSVSKGGGTEGSTYKHVLVITCKHFSNLAIPRAVLDSSFLYCVADRSL